MNTHLILYDHDNLCIWRESGLRLLFVFLRIIIFTWGLVLRLGYTRLGLEDFGALLCCYAAVLVAVSSATLMCMLASSLPSVDLGWV